MDMGELQFLDQSGHSSQTWDPNVQAEVDAARETFNTLTQDKGYSAFYQDPSDPARTGKRMTTFDPNAGTVVLIPPRQGG
jgi:hypothetical protein